MVLYPTDHRVDSQDDEVIRIPLQADAPVPAGTEPLWFSAKPRRSMPDDDPLALMLDSVANPGVLVWDTAAVPPVVTVTLARATTARYAGDDFTLEYELRGEFAGRRHTLAHGKLTVRGSVRLAAG